MWLRRQSRELSFDYRTSLLRKVRVVEWAEIEDEMDEQLPDDERNDLLRLDLLVRGKLRSQANLADVWVALEISGQVDEYDVVRAQRHAAILRRIGYSVLPAVAGEEVTEASLLSAGAANVVVIQNGTIQFWDEALATLPH